MTDASRPHDLDAERGVLGAIIHDDTGEAASAVLGTLQATDFYRPDHQVLYTLLGKLHDAGKPTDLIAVLDAAAGTVAAVGGRAYVCDLPHRVVSTANVRHFAGIVMKHAQARQLFDAAATITRGVLERRDPAELADEMSRHADAVRRSNGDDHDSSLGDAIAAVETERAFAPRTAIPTGFPELDALFGGGLRAGELVIVAARPSWGKSALAVSMLLHAAHQGEPGGLVSLEMSRAQVVHRIVSRLSEVPVQIVEAGGYDAQDQDRIDRGHELADLLPLRMWCPPEAQSVQAIGSRLRRWKREHGLSIAVVDFLGRIALPADKSKTTAQLIGQATKQLKALGNELGIPMVVCVQINRNAVDTVPRQRKDVDWWVNAPVPNPSHLKDSGSIEEDADKIILPVPADVLRKQNIVPNLDAPIGAAVLSVAKNRQGDGGIVQARWHGATASYRRASAPLRAVAGGRHFTEREAEND